MNPILKPVAKIPQKLDNTFRLTSKGVVIHSGLIKALDLSDADGVDVLNDQTDTKSIYLTKNKSGYKLIKRGNTYMINSLSLLRSLKKILGVERALYQIGEMENINGYSVVPIITRKNLLDGK